MQTDKGEIVLYQTDDGNSGIDVQLRDETVWLTLNQIADLFDRDKSVISRHLRNIFKTGELERPAVVAKNATTAADGKVYRVDWYNLDAIISVGYRVNSKRGTRFRIWATSILKEHLVRGFSVNRKRLAEKGISEIKQVVALLADTLESHALVNEQGLAVLEIVKGYTRTWNLLLQYDEDKLSGPTDRLPIRTTLELAPARTAISSLKTELVKKGEASELFGQERGEGLAGIIGAIQQTFGGQELYRGVAEKAAHLLYFVIKDHPFSDGNKRIATFLFLLFLRMNNALDERKFSDNALVSLTLLTAASDPDQKDILIRLIINLITGSE